MNAIGYARASTGDQHITLDAQRARMAQWCESNGHTLVAVYTDVASGSVDIDKRPGLSDALEAARGADLLLVTQRDRIARDVVINAMVERIVQKSGCNVFAVDSVGNGDSPEDALLRTLLAAFAQYERHLIAWRTSAALRQRRSQGYKNGGNVPYGYTADAAGLLSPCVAEQSTIARMRTLSDGGASLRAISADLCAHGITNRDGGAFHAQTISRILKRESGA